MALITLAPVALLLMIQIKFFPYHSEWITWLRRGLLALDLALVWTLWPGYRSGWGMRLWPKTSRWLVPAGVLSAAVLAYAAVVATFPDEHIYSVTNWVHGKNYWHDSELKSHGRPIWYGWIAPINALDVHGEDLINDAALAHIIKKNESSSDAQRWVATLPLKGRDLTEANLSDADLRHVDFSSAILNRADLSRAWAKEASFGLAQLQGASLAWAQLQSAILGGAQLQGASLDWAQLQGAYIGTVTFFGKIGLTRTQLDGTSFKKAFVWRADARDAIWENTRVSGPKTGPETTCEDKDGDCAWTAATFEALRRLITDKVPEGKGRRNIMKRIEASLDPSKAPKGEEEMAAVWADHMRASPVPAVYEKSVAAQWRKTACAAEGAPHVLRALFARLDDPYSPFGNDSPEKVKLAAAFLDKDCAGARGLSDDEITEIKVIRDSAPPPAPKP
jgi:hypothetical protein